MIPYRHPSHGKGRPSAWLGAINHTDAGGFCVLVMLFGVRSMFESAMFTAERFTWKGSFLFYTPSTHHLPNYSSHVYRVILEGDEE